MNAHQVTSRTEWQEWARQLEGGGWSTLLMPDHLGSASTFAPLVAAADVTTDLRVGNLVVNSDFFHPLRLAQEASTVDLLTDGRLELGLGSGWNRPEYDLLDLGYDRPRVRAERLADAVAQMKWAWSGEVRFDAAAGDRPAVPAPVQRPHPPLLIGGHGDKILGLAAREASIIGLAGLTWTGSRLEATGARREDLAERVAYVRDQAGDRADGLEFNLLVQYAEITDGDRDAAIGRAADHLELDPAVIVDSPLALVGSVDEVVDKVQEIREQVGISYFVVQGRLMEAMGPVVARLAGT